MVNLMYQPNKQKHEAKKDACPPGLKMYFLLVSY